MPGPCTWQGHLEDARIGVELEHGQAVDGIWVDGVQTPHIQEAEGSQGGGQCLQEVDMNGRMAKTPQLQRLGK
jgi:hypothetical protein